jgi:dihydrofolate reductase
MKEQNIMAIRVHTSMSLDGFSADANGLPALLTMPDFVPGESHGHAEFFRQCDAVIMGRTTFDPALGSPSWPWPGKKVFVLTSRPLTAPAGTDVHPCATPGQLLDELHASDLAGDAQLLGGPSTIRAFHALDAIDRLEIVVLPILLGTGLPLFPLGPDLNRVTFDQETSYPDGAVKLCYSARG